MKKVVILAPYSHPSACGIWMRVFADAKTLKENGYDVYVFSSNIVKGTKETSAAYEEFEGIKIYRFPVFLKLGGTSMFWNFIPALSKINPDIIHSHGYRHPHSLLSLILGKIIGKKVIHTTHAPFEKDKNRSTFLKFIDWLYSIVWWWELRTYDRVIRISNWEEPYLKKLGVKNSIYIPNGIKDDFFINQDKSLINNDPKRQILYMGRIDPVKQPEWIKYAAQKLNDYNFKIIGPLNVYDDFKSGSENLEIIKVKYNSSDFIKELNESDIYILPSIREAMPFTLIEAMSRGVFVISSATKGGTEVIQNEVNGFIVNSQDDLVSKIINIYQNWERLQEIRKNAIETSKAYSAKNSAKKLIELYNNLS